MFDYQTHFDSFCRENGLDLRLSAFEAVYAEIDEKIRLQSSKG